MSCSVQVLSCTKEASHLELKMCLVLGKPTKHSGWKSAASLLSCWYTQFSWSEIIWRGGVEGASPETWIDPFFLSHTAVAGATTTPLPSAPGCTGSIQVSGDEPTLPSLRPNPNPKPAPTQTLGLREGRVSPSPETWIDPMYCSISTLQGEGGTWG